MRLVAIRILEHVPAAPTEHERLTFCGSAQEREAHGRMGLGWLLSSPPISLTREATNNMMKKFFNILLVGQGLTLLLQAVFQYAYCFLSRGGFVRITTP